MSLKFISFNNQYDKKSKLFGRINNKDEDINETKNKMKTEERKKLLLERFPFMAQYFGEIFGFCYLDNFSKFRVAKSINAIFNIYHYIDIDEIRLEPINVNNLEIDGICITWNKHGIIRKEFYIDGDINYHEIVSQINGKEEKFLIDHVNKNVTTIRQEFL